MEQTQNVNGPYISVPDFLQKTALCPRLSRQEELVLAAAAANGDAAARQQLSQSYLPAVAGHIRSCSPQFQTLALVYACLQALEKAMDGFDFAQDSEPFSHRLSWWLRQTTVAYIAGRREAQSQSTHL